MSVPASVTVPLVACRSPTTASTSSSCPLPATPAMPKISPARTSKRDVAHDLVPAVVADGEVGDAQHRLRRMALAAVDGQLHVATDHQLGQVVLVRLAGNAAADHLAAADDGDPVGDLQHLVQLVADEDDRVALRLRACAGRRRSPSSPGASAPPLARPGPAPARCGRGPSGSRRAAASRPTASRPACPGRSPSRTGRPSSLMRCLEAARSRKTRPAIGSSPSRMFSATDRTGTSMKCWCTMLMPRRMASCGLAISTSLPSSRIWPASGTARP